jgi:hypothetical protein
MLGAPGGFSGGNGAGFGGWWIELVEDGPPTLDAR